ncbi:Vacuolar fusion protein CCZ1-like [Pseudocercospora fuligena]|uniref:Vacuolar fusion protein CCZ1-like n=1 Tax=Pseudocercospora fuligena TaxID=685502 RepID=A0A8H6VC00_9PEZI|nr:Vacuolar fusion protein CCZ1-like [Pseudocercospora fuligena]
MSAPQWQGQVVPARLSYLAIYNPSLGPTDDTFEEQLVFYYARAAHEARTAARKNARNDKAGGDAIREEDNQKLRRIGLAQGMVDFARSFSDGQPVDHIDTEKSRIVLHELELGWWVLASVDLTQLPGIPQSPPAESSKKGAERASPKPAVEYSSREVSPPALLIQQLIQAHYIFTLHHGPMTELFVRLRRDKFCIILERFWSRFSRTWDVLLHGNPATDIFGGLKLSSGGELGMGVGEEEWGSGERDVLEDLTRRTEGLVDLVVSRFGDAAPSKENVNLSDAESLPWMGSGNHPLASDGVIFGGINAITKPSLRNLSIWMRQIYSYGEYAYGVRDNPLRERRKRRKRNPPPVFESEAEPEEPKNGVPKLPKNVESRDFVPKAPEPEATVKALKDQYPEDESPPPTDKPGIPPPIVSAAETSLNKATKKAQTESEYTSQTDADDSSTTLGIPDQYMKYLTFGLSTLAKSNAPKRPEGPRRTSTSSSKTIKASRNVKPKPLAQQDGADSDPPKLASLDPIPDGEALQTKIAIQKRLEEKGHFLIGLKGNLDHVPDKDETDIDDLEDDAEGPRNVLRTLQVEVNPVAGDEPTPLQRKLSEAGLSAGRDDPEDFRRLRVLIYVHRPFMYCFLFEQRTPSLTIARFYKDLHQNLMPIHKPLLTSTNVARVAQRIEDAQASSSDSASITSRSKSVKDQGPSPIYDLIYDPALLTVHTSIPNIPDPGTPAAEGIISGKKDTGLPGWPAWTRIEALNVHSQILNTLASTRRNPHEYERTSKTSRGWWVVWMKLAPSVHEETEANPQPETQHEPNKSSEPAATDSDPAPAPLKPVDSDDTVTPSTKHPSTAATAKPQPANRIAFLVRKASDTKDSKTTAPSSGSRAASSMWNALTLRPTSTSDENTGGSGAGWGPAALAGGIGFDARKYVEGLLSLNR